MKRLILSASLLGTILCSSVHVFSQSASGQSGLEISQSINVSKYGVDGTGKTVNTVIIQRLIDSCSKAGGGVIYFPPGRYLTGTIILKSGVTINIGKGATLLGSPNVSDYIQIKPKYIALRTARESRQLIYAEDQENIALKGEGTIDGQGINFVRDGDDEGITRPHLIQFINCRNVEVTDLNMRNSGAWMQHYLACTNLKIRGLNVYNHNNYNNDGIDIDGCEDVTISDCIIDSDDDGICLKSTGARACRNVSITNSIVSSHCTAIKLGTESSGGFENIVISNCVVRPSKHPRTDFYGLALGHSALSIEMVDGGLLENLLINNISVDETTVPIFIRLGDRGRKYHHTQAQPGVGALKHVIISNFFARTSSTFSSSITGIPGKNAEHILLSNVRIVNTSKSSMIKLEQVEIPEKIKDFPIATMFGDSLPASGFYVRHANNIEFNNVTVVTEEGDTRPVYYFDDVHSSIVEEFNNGRDIRGSELIRRRNSRNITVRKKS